MQTLTAVVFDEVIAGTDIVYTSNFLLDTLGAPDRLTFHAVVDQVTGSSPNERLSMADRLTIQLVADDSSGTSPTAAVRIMHSGDGRNWDYKNGTAEIAATSIPTGATTAKIGSDTSSIATLANTRLEITLGGTTPAAHIKVYVSGRDW